MSNSVQEDFARRVAVLTSAIAGRALDDDLARDLNERHGPGSVAYESLAAACPHHRHPNGEIDLVMPLASGDGVAAGGAATFDGQSAGWKVYGPGSAHRPTVRGGRALVLYLLPDGAIEFTR